MPIGSAGGCLMALAVDCSSCGPVRVTSSPRAARQTVTVHERQHDPEQLPPAMRLAARSVSLRLAVEAAKARIGMWLASPALDSARSADHVLVEVLSLLDEQDMTAPNETRVEVQL